MRVGSTAVTPVIGRHAVTVPLCGHCERKGRYGRVISSAGYANGIPTVGPNVRNGLKRVLPMEYVL